MQKADIVINDLDDTTPITYTPTTGAGNQAMYTDLNAAIEPHLRETIELVFRPAVPLRGVKGKTTEKLVIPYEVTSTDGVVTVKEVTGQMVYMVPDDAPRTVREQLVNRMKKVPQDSQLSAVVLDNAFPY